MTKRELLVKTAEEMNKKMDLDPPINTKADDKTIIAGIRENCKELRADDFIGASALTQVARQVFAKLEIPEYVKITAAQETKKADKPAPKKNAEKARAKKVAKKQTKEIKKAAAKLAPKPTPKPKKERNSSAATVQAFCVKNRNCSFKDVLEFMQKNKIELARTTVNNILYHAHSTLACADKLGLLKTK